MTIEYMNNLYRDLLSNSPQTVTIPIPSDMGTGQIAQVVTKQGAVVSDWKMNYFSDMNVRGIKQRGLYSNAVLPERRRVVEYCRQPAGRQSCKGRILHLPWTRENGVSLLCAKQRLLF